MRLEKTVAACVEGPGRSEWESGRVEKLVVTYAQTFVVAAAVVAATGVVVVTVVVVAIVVVAGVA